MVTASSGLATLYSEHRSDDGQGLGVEALPRGGYRLGERHVCIRGRARYLHGECLVLRWQSTGAH